MSATLSRRQGTNTWEQFCNWVTSTDNRLYVGWFGVLMIPCLLAATIAFIVAFVAAPPVDIDGIREPVAGSLMYGNNIISGAVVPSSNSIGERTLTKRIDQEHCTRSSNWSRICYTDPWTHTQTVRKFPLTSHVCIDADQEVEDYQLERTAVIEPFIKRCCFPDGIEVETNSIGARDNSTRDDVVTIHERTSNGFTDAVDVHRGSTNKGNDETSSSGEQARNHEDSEPTNIQTIVSAGYPIAKLFPSIRLLLT